jgi:hypothetical protein
VNTGWRSLTLFALLGIASIICGCGTYVPALQEFYDPQDTQTMVDAVVSDVQCEVQSGIQFLILDDLDAARVSRALGKDQKPSLAWLRSWGAQITLTLTIDEKSSINPGLSLTKILPNAINSFSNGAVTTGQNFSLGIGATGSADGTRKETLSWLIDFKKFTDDRSLAVAKIERDRLYQAARESGSSTISSPCSNRNGILIQSDLKLREWLYAVMLPAFVRDGIHPDYADSLTAEAALTKKDVISHEITFVVLYGGNVTPAWKLVNVSTNQGSQLLFSAQRTRTQDLLITMGPAAGGALSQAAQNTTLASQIGLAVGNALRNNQ